MAQLTKACLLASLLMCAGISAADSITVMSYNILHGTDLSGEDALTSQGLAIKAAGPDFVGLQEVDVRCRRSGNVDQMAELARATGMYKAFAPHFEYQGGEYGLGLLSRVPLSAVKNDRITLFAKDGTMETRALLSAVAMLDGGTTVVVATVHMGLDQRTRLKQAGEIIKYLGGRGAPVILTGDMNAEPGTPELSVLETFFVNTGDDATGDHTYKVGEPTKTIDYIMVDRANLETVRKFQVLRNVKWSDHYPLLAIVRLKSLALPDIP